MLQTNKRMAFSQSQPQRQVLLHYETLRGILRFTNGSALRTLSWVPYPTLTTMGDPLLSRSSAYNVELLYHSHLQRRTQSQNTNDKRLSAFYEAVKKEIRAIKSILKNKTKGTI